MSATTDDDKNYDMECALIHVMRIISCPEDAKFNLEWASYHLWRATQGHPNEALVEIMHSELQNVEAKLSNVKV